jgi:hypothetical protein
VDELVDGDRRRRDVARAPWLAVELNPASVTKAQPSSLIVQVLTMCVERADFQDDLDGRPVCGSSGEQRGGFVDPDKAESVRTQRHFAIPL